MECHATNPERCCGELGREEAIFTPLEKSIVLQSSLTLGGRLLNFLSFSAVSTGLKGQSHHSLLQRCYRCVLMYDTSSQLKILR